MIGRPYNRAALISPITRVSLDMCVMRDNSAFEVVADCDIRGMAVAVGRQARWADVHEAGGAVGGFWRRESRCKYPAAGRYANCPHGPAEDQGLRTCEPDRDSCSLLTMVATMIMNGIR
jgi:hypothetical protein